ncbi:MAG: vitamin B12 dependent-methionine synthase activation domain-containing protein [Desulfosarcinaceae bacterium]
MRRIESLSRDMDTFLQPRITYRTFSLAAVDKTRIELDDGTCFTSRKLAKTMAQAFEICCFVATVGPGLEMEVEALMRQRRHADAYVLDTIGSMCAENVVEQFYQSMARRLAVKGQGLTLRFSPGYCDWPLDQQRRLFTLLSDRPSLEVQLNSHCLMSPRKSVSGLFGILPPGIPGTSPAYNPCDACKKGNCIARRSN